MKNPIIITECPKCGKMSAARTPYMQGMLDKDGKPYDENTIMLMPVECFEHIEFPKTKLDVQRSGFFLDSLLVPPGWFGDKPC